MKYPHGSLPGEVTGTHVHIPKDSWWLLRNDPGFGKEWKSASLKAPYRIAKSAITRGLSKDQVITVLRIWHMKHGHPVFEDDLERTYFAAADYAAPFVYKHEADEYWEEIRRIQGDPNARLHSKLRVAYFLMNTEQATANEISEKTGIPLKTVRNSILALKDSGKVVMPEFGVYRALQSSHWDWATLVGTVEDGYVLEDDPVMTCWWGQTVNERHRHKNGAVQMDCYDYCRDKTVTVIYTADQQFRSVLPHPDESEWVITEAGEVVENGTGHRFISVFPEFESWDIVGHRNGDRLDFRRGNLEAVGQKVAATVNDEEVDFFGRLCANCP